MCVFKNVLQVLVIALVLSGCVNTGKHLEDGYQFGDGLATAYEAAKDLIVMRQAYCEASEPEVKDSILRTIHTFYPDYPDDGICTGLDGILDAVEKRRESDIVREAAGDYRLEDTDPTLVGTEPKVEPDAVPEGAMGESTSSPADPNMASEPTATSGS